MASISDERMWIFFAVLTLIFFIYRKFKYGLRLLLLLVVGVGISDLLTVRLLKPWVGRLRPCREYQDVIVVVKGWCGGDYGFPSSHASNAAAIAAILWFLVPRKWFFAAAFIVLLVGFSRIYLGVHYPGDVLAGFVVGSIIGALVWRLWSRMGWIQNPSRMTIKS
ncbi:MAG: phosphatase PAP2 family protein [Pseudomonadota bacterium]